MALGRPSFRRNDRAEATPAPVPFSGDADEGQTARAALESERGKE